LLPALRTHNLAAPLPKNPAAVAGKALSTSLPLPAQQIPDEVTRYFLSLSGCECPDDRVTRLVSLATHKFVADLTNDALANCKSRQQARGGKADARLVLTTEDLAASSREFGISLKKPTYYADTPGPGGSSGPPPTAGQP